MEGEKKKKLTHAESLEILMRNMESMAKEIQSIKEKDGEGGRKVIEGVKEMMKQRADDSFLLQGNIGYFQLPNYPDQQDAFFKELQGLMVKYKVHSLVANLIKKF